MRRIDDDEPEETPSRHGRESRRSLRLIADALGVSVASFYEDDRRTDEAPGMEGGAAQRMSRDSAELLHAFVRLADPKDREACIAFVQAIAGKQAR